MWKRRVKRIICKWERGHTCPTYQFLSFSQPAGLAKIFRGGQSNQSQSLLCGVIFGLAMKKEDKRGDLQVNEKKNRCARLLISFLLPASRTGNVFPGVGHQIGLGLGLSHAEVSYLV